MKKSRFSDSQIMDSLKRVEAAQSVARAAGVRRPSSCDASKEARTC